MTEVCLKAENTLDHSHLLSEARKYAAEETSTAEAVAQAVCGAAHDQASVQLIVVVQEDSDSLGRLVARYKPEVKVLAVSP